MATNKTIQPSGETIVIPDFDEKPDARVYSQDISKLADNDNALNSKIASQLGDLNISFNGTLGGNVIDIMNSANIGITYYRNSNQPTNRPSGCDWGTYILFKSSSTSVGVLYFDYSHFAFNYSINPTTATSISWTIL